jgi:site-specific DNA-methyltransferase (adenine-specific)
MTPQIQVGNAVIYAGNNLEVLPTLADNSVDSIVCDPPYELGFMGKTWDNSGIAYSVELWRECLRVLKPGGHLLAFGGTRTWHRLAVAIEDAGFEIRDNIAWLYGSGFPKSHNISKAIDRAAGITERPIIGKKYGADRLLHQAPDGNRDGEGTWGNEIGRDPFIRGSVSDEAKQWDGWGTALKPAHEPIVVARKPVIGTVAENVLQYGTGAINIDATRIQGADALQGRSRHGGGIVGNASSFELPDSKSSMPAGRWPANIILDEYTAELLDQQTATLKGATSMSERMDRSAFSSGEGELVKRDVYGDSGGASRFFYVAKASKRDRNEGLDTLPIQRPDLRTSTGMGTFEEKGVQPQRNFHPTVKPTALMRYLIRLVTPENGLVLDPFCGSGSTGKAAILEGKRFIGIELTPEYLPIIQGRLEHAYQTMLNKPEEDDLFA